MIVVTRGDQFGQVKSSEVPFNSRPSEVERGSCGSRRYVHSAHPPSLAETFLGLNKIL